MKAIIPLDMDRNKDGQITPDELIQSALWIFLSLLVLLGALIGGVWLLIIGPAIVRIVGGVLAVSALLTAALLLYRMTYPERNERRDITTWKLAHERAKWEFAELQGVSQDARSGTLAQAEIDAAAYQILERYYNGKPWTREACMEAGLMTAQLWNAANKLLKKRGIRSGRKGILRPDTLAEAWGIYVRKKQQANQHRVANGNWTERR